MIMLITLNSYSLIINVNLSNELIEQPRSQAQCPDTT